jgi:arylsulfatase A-like enzyme
MLAVDDGVGKVLAALRKHGIEDDTLLFFMSDNGGPSDGRLPCFNTPFTGNKGGMKEGGVSASPTSCSGKPDCRLAKSMIIP